MQKFRVTGSKWLWFSIHVIKVPANFIHFSQEMQLFLKKERWKLGLILMCWSRIVETASKRNSFMEEHFIISFVKSPPKTHRSKVHNKCNIALKYYNMRKFSTHYTVQLQVDWERPKQVVHFLGVRPPTLSLRSMTICNYCCSV